MFFTPIDQWLRQTAHALSPRSPALQKLDEAIRRANIREAEGREELADLTANSRFHNNAQTQQETLNKAAVQEVRDAFDRWVSDQSRKGQKWRDSVRNQRGAVSKLYDQIDALSVRYPAPDTGGALAGVIAARDASIPVLLPARSAWPTAARRWRN